MSTNTSLNHRTTLSNESVNFIKETVLSELKITTPLGVKEINDIEDWIHEVIDGKYDEHGNNINLSPVENSKIQKAEKLLSELLSVWDNKTDKYLDDLNNKLGF